MGVLVVHAVHHGGLEHHIGAHFHGAQGRCRVGGEEGVAGAAAENNDAALFEVPDGLAADIGFCNLVHGDGGLYPDLNAALLEAVRDR